ncbi:MAG: precorrin-3B C(17)-methyltransferase [Carbonactinosporaceae bacterium]
MIGLVAVTAAGRAAAARLAAAWPAETRLYDGPATDAVPRAWRECDALVCFLATGATVRLIAPLLAGKHTDPPVVCVDDAGQYAIALVGGHAGGANDLAVRVAATLGAEPVVTTATDTAGLPGLDVLGWPVEGAVAAVTRAILDGEPVRLDAEMTWPLPALPDNVRLGAGPAGGEFRIVVTDRALAPDPQTVVLRPPSLVVGVGASRGVAAEEVIDLIDSALAGAGLSPLSVVRVATVNAKACEPGMVAAARHYGWPLVTYPANRLAAVDVPNPSAATLAAVGTPSVAEAAALVEADVLVVPKHKSAMATAAVARIRPRGRLALVGLGPGARDLLTPRAATELRRASIIVGLDQYVEQVRDLLRPGTEVLATGLGEEQARAQAAVGEAQRSHAVALVCSGDAGVYAMASPALELAGDDIDVLGIPGVTANLAAAALLGAPLGHDHAVISLSDLHTPWDAIERRIRGAAEGDFVVTIYNPRSRGRGWQLPTALALLAAHRSPATPVGVVRDASRPEERVELTTLAGLDLESVDMRSVVAVGSTNTRVVSGRMVTPRGYQWLPP